MARSAGFSIALVCAVLLGLVLYSCVTQAHDRNYPQYDAWYNSLHRNGVGNSMASVSCCSIRDCHVTEAEIRGNRWWARLGMRRFVEGHADQFDWDLADWVEVPPDKVLERNDNPTGEAVICHSVTNQFGGSKIDVKASAIWCFVPPAES